MRDSRRLGIFTEVKAVGRVKRLAASSVSTTTLAA
jgi:hypothetical protein